MAFRKNLQAQKAHNQLKRRHLQKLLLGGVLLIYISISHIFLPVFKTHRHSGLFFAKWNMFSFPPLKAVNDITWDGGQSFFFRDHRKKAVSSGVSVWRIFYLFYISKTIEMPKSVREQITAFCKCRSFDIVLLKGSLSDHIIYKKQLKTLKRKTLSNLQYEK